jgi:exosortase N
MVKTIASNQLFAPLIFIGGIIGAFILFNPDYLITDTFLWVGVVTLPITFKVASDIKTTRFFWFVLVFGIFTLFFSSTFGAYCVMVFAILLVLETHLGKLSLLTMFHLFLLSPLFKYFTSLITFPLRIQISKIVATILQLADLDIELSGNLIKFSGTEFLVDKACMGLHLLSYSFLCGLLILAFFEKKNNSLKLSSISLFMIVIMGLNLIANTVRATLLILFKIMPDHWFHDTIGLLIFILYILLPFYFIVKWQRKKNVELVTIDRAEVDKYGRLKVFLAFILFILIIWNNNLNKTFTVKPPTIQISGYTQTQLKSNVTKLSNDNTLVYIKPPVAPYRADHNPLICWEGSGYSFKKIATLTLNNHEVYYAELVKGKDKLYTAWWFQYENHITNNQWEWRWNTIKNNHQYSMINVTCSSLKELEISSIYILNNNNQISQIQ